MTQVQRFEHAVVSRYRVIGTTVVGKIDCTGEDNSTIQVSMPASFSETSRAFPFGTVSYSYSDPQTRTATLSATVEVQVITPPYVVDDWIFAEHTDRGVFDLNVDGRQWAHDESQVP